MKCPECGDELWITIEADEDDDEITIGICYSCPRMFSIEGWLDPTLSDEIPFIDNDENTIA